MSEQQAAAAQEFTLAERDKIMSEQKLSFMEALDQWTDANVIAPLLTDSEGGEELTEETLESVKKAIRAKVLESYRNGQQAGPRKPHGRRA